MSSNQAALLRAFLDTIHYSGAGSLIAPMVASRGVVFMLHNVTPEPVGAFEPNRILKVTPDFLDSVIALVKTLGFDIVALDEVPERLSCADDTRRFACFTLDDGYRDNRDFAYPVFKRHNAPFTIYVPSEFAEGRGDLWWLTLEHVIAKVEAVETEIGGGPDRFETSSPKLKDAAFDSIYWRLRKLPEVEARAEVSRIAKRAGADPSQTCKQLVMSWDEVRELVKDPLVTIGGHTKGHWALAKLPADDAWREISDSIAIVEQQLDRPCRHFSYPYGCENSAGDREFKLAANAGVLTAVTTRKGLLKAHHADALHALPRLSLNGDYQHTRYIETMLTGAPFALYDAAKLLKRAASGRRRAA